MLRLFVIGLLACGLSSCSTTEYNPTVYPFTIDDALISAKPIKKIIIADVNVGIPSRKFLQEAEGRVDGILSAYLRENEFQILSPRLFTQAWKAAARVNGNPFDPTTGKMNQKTFALNVMAATEQLTKNNQVDAIIFTDILEREVQFSVGLSHLARWDGVSRKPTLRGPGDGVAGGFDWGLSASAASLWVNIYNVELKRMFTGIGGLDANDAIDTKASSGRFTRRRHILENPRHLREGVELAMHPFIPMEKYPGEPR